MTHKLLFVSLSAALALGAVATAAVAAPGSGLSGVRSADGSKLLSAVHDDDDYRGRSWSHRFRWDDDDQGTTGGGGIAGITAIGTMTNVGQAEIVTIAMGTGTASPTNSLNF